MMVAPSGLRLTRTFAVMEVSQATYDEISGKLKAADYGQAFVETEDHGIALDMHGIALAVVPAMPESSGSPGDEGVDGGLPSA